MILNVLSFEFIFIFHPVLFTTFTQFIIELIDNSHESLYLSEIHMEISWLVHCFMKIVFYLFFFLSWPNFDDLAFGVFTFHCQLFRLLSKLDELSGKFELCNFDSEFSEINFNGIKDGTYPLAPWLRCSSPELH